MLWDPFLYCINDSIQGNSETGNKVFVLPSKVSINIQMIQKCRFCNAVNKGTGICFLYTFGKQSVAASHYKIFQCTFCTVVVYAEMTIFQIPSQIYFLIKHIQNGITNKGRPVYRIFHRMQPFKQGVHNRTGLFLVLLIFFFRCFVIDHILNLIEDTDP